MDRKPKLKSEQRMKLSKADLLKQPTENKRMYEQLSDDYSTENAINEEERSIWFIAVSESNAGVRETYSGMRYMEEIVVDTVKTDNLRIFITDHNPSSQNAVGKVVETAREDGKLKVKVKFATTPDADSIYRKFIEGVLTDVSIGYRYSVEDADIIDIDGADMPLVRLNNVEIFELSSVWRGFDSGAKVGRSSEEVILNDIITPEKSVSSAAVQKRIHLMRLELKL